MKVACSITLVAAVSVVFSGAVAVGVVVSSGTDPGTLCFASFVVETAEFRFIEARRVRPFLCVPFISSLTRSGRVDGGGAVVLRRRRLLAFLRFITVCVCVCERACVDTSA